MTTRKPAKTTKASTKKTPAKGTKKPSMQFPGKLPKKPAAKPTKRPLLGADFTGPRGQLWAIRKRKTKDNAWLPDKCALMFDKHATDEDQGGPLLFYTGWTCTPGPGETFPISRLELSLDRLCREWEEEAGGKGWELQIVSAL